jgi:guanine deaminase
MERAFLKQAIDLAVESIRRNGGPFGALVVRDGVVIATGSNQVTRTNDPTAHAEVIAIREACRVLGNFQLGGCDIYASAEPCPMCLGAIYWARPDRVFFAASQDQAAAAGFDDSFIYREIRVPAASRTIPMIHVPDKHSTLPFQDWAAKTDKIEY